MLPRLLSLVWVKHMVWALTGGGAEPPGSNKSIRGKQDLWVGGPDRPRGRAEQCSGEGLCLEEGRGRGVVSDVVCAVCERVADGGGCCHCRQVSRYDLCSQRLTLMVLTQGQLYLIEKDKTHSIQSISTQGGQNIFSATKHNQNPLKVFITLQRQNFFKYLTLRNVNTFLTKKAKCYMSPKHKLLNRYFASIKQKTKLNPEPSDQRTSE